MEDLSKFGVSPVSTDSKELYRRNCFCCLVSSVNFLVPYDKLESFVFICMRSGHNVSLLVDDNIVIL